MSRRARFPTSDRRLATMAALAGLSLLVVAMVGVRIAYTGTAEYGNLPWNLVLAWVPFLLALFVYDGARRDRGALPMLAAGALWLLFFPNAPYLVTDAEHLREVGGAPVWFDVVLLSAAAWAGLALGFASLYLIQAVVRRFLGPAAAWLAVAVVLAIGSFGVFLGRFGRWNSWDLFVEPRSLLGEILGGLADPLAYPRALAVTVLFTAFLAATYLVFYAFARLSNALGDEPGAV